MVKKIFVVLFSLLLVATLVSATKTEITVKTVPYRDIQITVLAAAASGSPVIDRLNGTADGYGDLTLNFSSDRQDYSLIIFLKRNGENMMDPRKIIDQEIGEPLRIEMFPEWFTPIETPNKTLEVISAPIENITQNETINNTETEVLNTSSDIVTEETSSTKFPFSGHSIVGEDGVITLKTLYYSGGIIGLFVIAFVFLMIGKHSAKKTPAIEIKKPNQEDENLKKENAIKEAEEKLKKAQEDLDALKGDDTKKKIDEIKKRLIADEQELLRLRKGK